jgi:hypothetical protein
MAGEKQDESLTLNDKPMSAWEAAAAMGIDMSLIEYSLGLTTDDRMFQHDCALRTVLMLEEAGKQLRG